MNSRIMTSRAVEKVAFLATTPMDVSNEEFDSPKGFIKERVNRAVGAGTGALIGGALAIPGLIWAGRSGNLKGSGKNLKKLIGGGKAAIKQNNPEILEQVGEEVGEEGMKKLVKTVAAASPGLMGASLGGFIGDVRSMRATERDAGKKPTGFWRWYGRNFASTLGNAVLPGGGLLADYGVSRKLYPAKDA